MKASLLPLQTYFAAKKPSIVLCTGLEAQQEGTNAMNVMRKHPAEAIVKFMGIQNDVNPSCDDITPIGFENGGES